MSMNFKLQTKRTLPAYVTKTMNKSSATSSPEKALLLDIHPSKGAVPQEEVNPHSSEYEPA